MTAPGRLEDLGLAVAAEVVGDDLDLVVAVPLLGLRLGDADRGDLGVAVGDPRDAVVVDRARAQPADVLGDEDALLEADVGQLQGGDEVADRVDAGDGRTAELVDVDEAAFDGDAGLLVAEPLGHRAPPDGDEQQVGVEGLAVLERDLDPGRRVLDALEADARARRRCRACGTPARAAWSWPRPRAGTRWGSASTIVTSAPKDFQTLANSTPMTPPPRMTAERGT